MQKKYVRCPSKFYLKLNRERIKVEHKVYNNNAEVTKIVREEWHALCASGKKSTETCAKRTRSATPWSGKHFNTAQHGNYKLTML
jgi:hypothetical protein